MLQYNTTYQSLKKVTAEWHAGHLQWEYSWNYLKFYEDGSVMYCTTSNKPNELDWFHINNKEAFFYSGSFSIKTNSMLEIEIPVEIGVLNFDGLMSNNQLILRSTNSQMGINNIWDEYLIPNKLI